MFDQPQWRIYYSDGSTYYGCVMQAPKRGVQVILQRHGRKGVRKLRLAEYYLWSPSLGRWLEMLDAAAVINRSLQEEYVIVLAGEYINEEDHERILIRADNDPEFRPIAAPPPHKAWANGR